MKYLKAKHLKLLALTAAALAVAALLFFRTVARRQALNRDDEAWQSAVSQAKDELESAREALALAMQGTWIRTVEEDPNSLLELAVSPTAMDYNFRSIRYPEYDQTLYSYTWEAVDETTILIGYPEGGFAQILVTVTPATREEPEKLTFTPAITVVSEQEVWERSAP